MCSWPVEVWSFRTPSLAPPVRAGSRCRRNGVARSGTTGPSHHRPVWTSRFLRHRGVRATPGTSALSGHAVRAGGIRRAVRSRLARRDRWKGGASSAHQPRHAWRARGAWRAPNRARVPGTRIACGFCPQRGGIGDCAGVRRRRPDRPSKPRISKQSALMAAPARRPGVGYSRTILCLLV